MLRLRWRPLLPFLGSLSPPLCFHLLDHIPCSMTEGAPSRTPAATSLNPRVDRRSLAAIQGLLVHRFSAASKPGRPPSFVCFTLDLSARPPTCRRRGGTTPRVSSQLSVAHRRGLPPPYQRSTLITTWLAFWQHPEREAVVPPSLIFLLLVGADGSTCRVAGPSSRGAWCSMPAGFLFLMWASR